MGNKYDFVVCIIGVYYREIIFKLICVIIVVLLKWLFLFIGFCFICIIEENYWVNKLFRSLVKELIMK